MPEMAHLAGGVTVRFRLLSVTQSGRTGETFRLLLGNHPENTMRCDCQPTDEHLCSSARGVTPAAH